MIETRSSGARRAREPQSTANGSAARNLLERSFVEVGRRTKVIGRFPGETSALSLIWAVLELTSRGWRGVVMTPKTVAEVERLRRAQKVNATGEKAGEGKGVGAA